MATEPLLTLSEIVAQAREYGAVLGLPGNTFDRLGEHNDFAQPFVAVDHGYSFVVCERGSEFERRATNDPDELLYWIFESVTFGLACSYEIRNRIAGQDCRRLLFKCQLELMAKLKASWRSRLLTKLNHTLREAPFTDGEASFLF